VKTLKIASISHNHFEKRECRMGMASLEDLAEMMPYMNHYVMKSERLDDRYLGEGSISIAEIIYAEKMKSRAQ
jgi:hypothetical protein